MTCKGGIIDKEDRGGNEQGNYKLSHIYDGVILSGHRHLQWGIIYLDKILEFYKHMGLCTLYTYSSYLYMTETDSL